MIPDTGAPCGQSPAWLPPPASSSASGPASIASANKEPEVTASGTTATSSAWSRYCSYVESMASRGQRVDRRLALEAMFLGPGLVYRTPTVDCTAS